MRPLCFPGRRTKVHCFLPLVMPCHLWAANIGKDAWIYSGSIKERRQVKAILGDVGREIRSCNRPQAMETARAPATTPTKSPTVRMSLCHFQRWISRLVVHSGLFSLSMLRASLRANVMAMGCGPSPNGPTVLLARMHRAPFVLRRSVRAYGAPVAPRTEATMYRPRCRDPAGAVGSR